MMSIKDITIVITSFKSEKDKRIKNYYLSESYFDLINKWINEEKSYFLNGNGGQNENYFYNFWKKIFIKV